VAKSLGATIWKAGLPRIAGVKSFASLRTRASRVDFDGYTLLVADLRDIINSKRAAGRPQDLAVLGLLEAALNEKEKNEKGKA
jgi:hypothetical protein